MSSSTEEPSKEHEAFEPYCSVCGGCGYIGCDGVRHFLEVHVRGKTDCANEEVFIQEIIDYVE